MPSRLKFHSESPDFRKVRAIIFDMDGLLLDTERLFLKAYTQAANELGVDLPEALYLQMVGHRADASQAILKAGLPDSAPVQEIIDSARRTYFSLLEKGVPLRPGALAVLEYCNQRQLPLAVATSTHHALATSKLERAGLLDLFVSVISGDQVEMGKPAPDVYLKAADTLSIPPKECLVLEDSPPGIQSAKAANTMAVLIPDLIPVNDDSRRDAAVVFESLVQFLHMFRAAMQSQG